MEILTPTEVFGKISNKLKLTFFSVIGIGIMAHMYMYMNRIVNHDSVWSLNNSGSTYTSGRWFLDIISNIAYIYDGNYVTPWGIGLTTLVIYALASCIISTVYNIKEKWISVIVGGLIIVFPTVTSNNLYIFTAHYYSFAFLLVCLSVYFIQKRKNILGAILLTLSLGIYQAYLPFELTALVVIILGKCLKLEKNTKDIFFEAVRYVFTVILGLLVYFLINKLYLTMKDASMAAYMGLDSMGKVRISELPQLVILCYRKFIDFFIHDFAGINSVFWLKLFGVLAMASIFVFIISWYRNNKLNVDVYRVGLIILVLVVFPIAIEFIYIMCHVEKGINTMTSYSLIFIFILPLLFLDNCDICFVKKNIKNILQWLGIVTCSLTIIYYGVIANETYLALQYSNKNVEMYFNQLATQIKSLKGYSNELEVAFIGDVKDESLPDVACDYTIRGCYSASELINLYSREYFMTMNSGYECEFAKAEVVEKLSKIQEVQEMPEYPMEGSIKIIDNTIVVKFSE